MSIAVIGAGGIGQAFASQVVRAGFDVLISNSRGPESLISVVETLGPRAKAVTVQEAAAADMVLISIPWIHQPEALAPLPNWGGRIVIDPSNPFLPPNFAIADLGGRTSSEVFADLVPGAKLVKAFNTLPTKVLASDPNEAGGKRVIVYSGDDAESKGEVARLIEKMGFVAIDLGGLVSGGRLQQVPGGPFAGSNIIKMP